MLPSKRSQFLSNETKALLCCLALWVVSCRTQAAIIAASSISLADVSNAVALAHTGDTVVVPAGTATWDGSLYVSNNITIEGAGMGESVIIDNAPRQPPYPGMIALYPTGTNLMRFTGFTLEGGANTAMYVHAIFQIMGGGNDVTNNWVRVDNCMFTNLYSSPDILVVDAIGVIDHCVFDTTGQAIQVQAPDWGGGNWGNGSWADDPYWGSSKFLFIENNVFYSATPLAGGVDSYEGARWVFRYNICTNASLTLHGTEGQGRGAKELEAYDNLFVSTSLGTLGQFRSGSGILFGNAFVNYNSFMGLETYRLFNRSANWGGSCGYNSYDSNDVAGGVYYTGTHTGTNGSPVLVDKNANWTPNEWAGTDREFVLNNLSQSMSGWGTTTNLYSFIEGNTSNSITFYYYTGYGYTNLFFNNGDTYQIRAVFRSLDQPGMGKGDLLSGLPAAPAQWPNEVSEPLYAWGNTQNGTTITNFFSTDETGEVIENRDFFNNTPKPGYTPFTYPHPLDTGEGPPLGDAPLAPPTGLRVVSR
jgi:hypothetical protein